MIHQYYFERPLLAVKKRAIPILKRAACKDITSVDIQFTGHPCLEFQVIDCAVQSVVYARVVGVAVYQYGPGGIEQGRLVALCICRGI